MSDIFNGYKESTTNTRRQGKGIFQKQEDVFSQSPFNYPVYRVEYQDQKEYALWLINCRGLNFHDAHEIASQIWKEEAEDGVLVRVEVGRIE